jgi:hypothetical protein
MKKETVCNSQIKWEDMYDLFYTYATNENFRNEFEEMLKRRNYYDLDKELAKCNDDISKSIYADRFASIVVYCVS